MVRYYPGMLEEVREELEKDSKGSTANTKKALTAFGFLSESILRRKEWGVEKLVEFCTGGTLAAGTQEYNKAYEEIETVLELQKRIGYKEFGERKEEERKFILHKSYEERWNFIYSLPMPLSDKKTERTRKVIEKQEIEIKKISIFGKIKNFWGNYTQRKAERKEERRRNKKPLYRGVGTGWVRPAVYGGAALFAGAVFYLTHQDEVTFKRTDRVQEIVKTEDLGKKFEVYKTREEKRVAWAFRKKTIEERQERMMKPVKNAAEAIRAGSLEFISIFGADARTAEGYKPGLDFAAANEIEEARKEVKKLENSYDEAVNQIYGGKVDAAEEAKKISRLKIEAEFKLMNLEKGVVG